MSYEIDGKNRDFVPLIPQNLTELHVVNPVNGIVVLPELTEGPHNLTIYVVCGIYNYHGAHPHGAPFMPTSPNSTNYTASWTDTIYFTIDTQNQLNDIPEFQAWIVLPLFLISTMAVVIVSKRGF